MSQERPTRTLDALQRLTKQEIDRRMEGLLAELAASAGSGGSGLLGDKDDLAPRRISAAELVRRMEPFLSYN